MSFILEGDFEEAIYWFEQAITFEPNNASYHYRCSISCSRSYRWKKAMKHALRAVELAPGTADYEYHLQIVQARLLVADFKVALAASTPEKAVNSLELLRQAVELDPLYAEAFYYLGTMSLSMNRIEDAIKYAKQALLLEPQDAKAMKLLLIARRKKRMRKHLIQKRD